MFHDASCSVKSTNNKDVKHKSKAVITVYNCCARSIRCWIANRVQRQKKKRARQRKLSCWRAKKAFAFWFMLSISLYNEQPSMQNNSEFAFNNQIRLDLQKEINSENLISSAKCARGERITRFGAGKNYKWKLALIR